MVAQIAPPLSNLHPLCKLLELFSSVRGGFAPAWEAQSQNLLLGEIWGCAGEGLGVVEPYRGFGVGLGERWAGA